MRNTSNRCAERMGVIATRNRAESVLHALGMVIPTSIAYLLIVLILSPLQAQNNAMNNTDLQTPTDSSETITLGAGCFWCVEAVFENLKGVHSAVSGYMGGSIKNPSYREVCTGRTGHAEVVQVHYDPAVISTATLLEVFFATHDPTTLNRQGADAGTQYRSAIFFHSEVQEQEAKDAITRATRDWQHAIVTEVTQASAFYKAEDYHQAYYEQNGEAPYCRAVILPKMRKLNTGFQHLLKMQ